MTLPDHSPPALIIMAPMEGIVDSTLRNIFSSIGGIDRCVTEFIRITSQKLPERVFRKLFPEIDQRSRTENGTVVFAQLLGDNPETMAINANKLAAMGAAGIDINFGCPARTVNNHGGGSVLLQNPEKIYRIVSKIRSAIPDNVPVTTKIRLGFKDKDRLIDNVLAIEAAGAREVTVHARTKVQGYKPPAHWQDIARVREAVAIDVIANGDMWSISDINQCIQISHCEKIMLGRGLVACPELALSAKGLLSTSFLWGDICLLLIHYLEKLQATCPERFQHALIKQWLVYLRQHYGDAHIFFQTIKRIKDASLLKQAISRELHRAHIQNPVSGKLGKLDLGILLYRTIRQSPSTI